VFYVDAVCGFAQRSGRRERKVLSGEAITAMLTTPSDYAPISVSSAELVFSFAL